MCGEAYPGRFLPASLVEGLRRQSLLGPVSLSCSPRSGLVRPHRKVCVSPSLVDGEVSKVYAVLVMVKPGDPALTDVERRQMQECMVAAGLHKVSHRTYSCCTRSEFTENLVVAQQGGERSDQVYMDVGFWDEFKGDMAEAIVKEMLRSATTPLA